MKFHLQVVERLERDLDSSINDQSDPCRRRRTTSSTTNHFFAPLSGPSWKTSYAVKEAANVHDALVLLDADGIDAVLTDIEMPGGLSGLDLAKMIRAMWPSMALIVMSAVLSRALANYRRTLSC